MKKRVLLITGIVTIAIASIGGMSFAQESNGFRVGSNPLSMMRQSQTGERNNRGCQGDNNMIAIMRENGFEEMAGYMEDGNVEEMNQWMDNLSQEDYENMLEIMNENGYGPMSQMMESLGREGMIEMYQSMGSRSGSKFGRMGQMMRKF
ncbi:hypothetical protein Amet_1095 [Alkaliphilus metalliredigens QYMF]|uniref:Uncharacterized protein n=1 Tax=Alkaliphilus metalliredigens (strain QYMF) TaxID=293826 RepID=A6TM89_ALKMQ|nr:hypothetical protein [Alkaliphilus metalliredigens]ABR47307.1 hypothetical protein Amet_1095 [Alkaliphilus metalliredigens QYMF]